MRGLAWVTLLTVSGLVGISACGSGDEPSDSNGGSAGLGGEGNGGEGSGGESSGGESSGGTTSGGAESGGAATSGGNPNSGGSETSSGGSSGEDCGNGALDGGEDCDPGINACCKTDCSGPAPSTTVCRESGDGCEVEETCDGESLECPADRVTCAEVTLAAASSTQVELETSLGCDILSPSCLTSSDSGGKEVVVHYQAPAAGDYSFFAEAEVPVVLSAQEELSCTPDELDCSRNASLATITLTLVKDQMIELVVEPTEDEDTTILLAVRPPAPPAWTCGAMDYGDGSCDCGCGALDLDCATEDIDACERSACGEEAPDANDITGCGTSPPSGWTCDPLAYVDTRCDCGCGRVDPSCEDTQVDSCDRNLCPLGMTPVPDQAQRCMGIFWECDPAAFGDGTCDCGCGALDSDCATVDDCETSQCQAPFSPDSTNPGLCTEGWECDTDWFGDGKCDCGCGALDPDCSSASVTACYYQSCTTGAPAPNNNTICVEGGTPPPSGWTCNELLYGDDACDCGCGVTDPDCQATAASACERVNCTETPLADDTTQCEAFPARWFCDQKAYYDPVCDCGCGMPDPACESASSCGTDACPSGSPDDGSGRCGGVPAGWECAQDFYGDGTCSCGCGAQDSDCADLDITSCEEEICGTEAVVSDNNATCETVPSEWDCLPQLYYDAVCDCGCGAMDPACSASAPSCGRSGCIPPTVVDDAESWNCTTP